MQAVEQGGIYTLAIQDDHRYVQTHQKYYLEPLNNPFQVTV